MEYPKAAVERAMKVQEVLLKAMSKEITWIAAAEILGVSARTMRRFRWRYEKDGYDGLIDHRRRTPSLRRAPAEQVGKVLGLYGDTYAGFNVRHFHKIATREHGVTLSYTLVKKALQGAGLVRKRKRRGRHHQRREPRACFGEMLHIDGSRHEWLSLCPNEKQTLILVIDDATKRVLYGQLWEAETTEAVMTALRDVVKAHGLPMALYSDRAGWAFYTPKVGGPVDKSKKTQIGRALERLGIEHIPAYSPQARGRSERANRTFQDQLVNELRVAKVRSIEAANRYLRKRYVPTYNHDYARAPASPESAFVPLGNADVDAYFCSEETRVVGKDNTVIWGTVRMQIAKQPGRSTCAGLKVIVRRTLDGRHAIHWGTRALGQFDARGRPLGGVLAHHTLVDRKEVQALSEQRPIPEKRTDHLSNESGQFTC